MPEGQEMLNCPNPKYIFYSLGNFIFDQMWSQDTREGLAIKIQISKPKSLNQLQGTHQSAKLDSVELIPIIIDNYSTPRPATAEETKNILKKIDINESILH
jgi:poly-gamma-glutamate synthesis protein (capsule biosynthesis protein)